jgi:hypothetical protein
MLRPKGKRFPRGTIGREDRRMAADQPNKKFFLYIDDNGTSWNKLSSQDAGCAAIDGNAAFVLGTPVWEDASPRTKMARHAVFMDPTTFRTKRCTIFTTTAFAAVTGTTTLSVNLPGEATPVTYNLSKKVPEKQRLAKTSRQLIDHA